MNQQHYQKKYIPQSSLAALLKLDLFNNHLYHFSSFRSPLILNLHHHPLTFKEILLRKIKTINLSKFLNVVHGD